jgi:hypothetical protein
MFSRHVLKTAKQETRVAEGSRVCWCVALMKIGAFDVLSFRILVCCIAKIALFQNVHRVRPFRSRLCGRCHSSRYAQGRAVRLDQCNIGTRASTFQNRCPSQGDIRGCAVIQSHKIKRQKKKKKNWRKNNNQEK